MPPRTTMYCPSCQANSVHNKLKLCQISLTSAVYLCEDKNCPYPKGYDWIEVKRSLDELLYEKQHSTCDSDLDNWLEEAFEKEMSNVDACKNITNTNGDNFLAEIFKEMESGTGNIEQESVNLPCVENVPPKTSQVIVNMEEKTNKSSCDYLESIFDFDENFVLNYKNS